MAQLSLAATPLLDTLLVSVEILVSVELPWQIKPLSMLG
jgi:hypothetical protein